MSADIYSKKSTQFAEFHSLSANRILLCTSSNRKQTSSSWSCPYFEDNYKRLTPAAPHKKTTGVVAKGNAKE